VTTPRATRQFRAMGCRSSVVVEADDTDVERLAELSMIRIARLEATWSRFLPDSDISRINAAGGAPVAVRAATVTLLLAMAEATRATDGAYDPTVLHRGTRSNTPCRWLERVSIDATACVVRADGVQLDPGGIGKGLGADLVVDSAVADGASAAVVSLGGDVRLAAPAGSRHVVEIAAPEGDAVLDRIVVADGAVATSGLRRGDLVDPATGEFVAGATGGSGVGVVQASVLAGTGAAAEAITKLVLVRGEAVLGRLDEAGIGVLAVRGDGSLARNESWRCTRVAPDEAVA
jgi:FAD:protein FMN transferase